MYKYYYICDENGKSNCVIRSFCKLYNDNYKNVYNELCSIQKGINSKSFNDIEVFEEYMKRHNTFAIDTEKEKLIKELEFDNDSYIIFCWDKNDYYHMVPIINNIIYDKSDKCLDLFPITIYKYNKK